MRVIHIRFKNLNSLVGEWEIDLTHPAFIGDGIFAITGPTGAGKSTILDAICLALYGRTPRLKKVTKSSNEIMSRQTGECFAEVTFESQSDRYRCHWSQHRARKRFDGDLQPPKHEISDADSGKVLETKIKEVADRIEAATGMDFDRFTRSMLLAQGGFAAFLQASPDDRAPILEQITGTEIYSQISIRVHELRSVERNKLDLLQAELAGMNLLTSEEEQQLGVDLEQNVQHATEFSRQIEERKRDVSWIEGMDRLDGELKQVELQMVDWQRRIDFFMPEQARLDAAIRALELDADYAALLAIRQTQEKDQKSLNECCESLPNCEEAVSLAVGVEKRTAEELEVRKEEQRKLQPLIRTVRDLDLKIAEKERPIKLINDSIVEISTSIDTHRTKQNSECIDLGLKRKALSELLEQLAVTSVDEGLVEHLTGIRSQFEVLQNLHNQLVGKQSEIGKVEGQLKEAMRFWQDLSEKLEKEKSCLNSAQVVLSEKNAELQAILDSRELPDWRNKQSLLLAQRDLFEKATVATQSLLKSKQAVEELGNRKKNLVDEESTLTDQMESQTGKQVILEKEVGLLETQLTLLKKIESLEDARNQLRDNEACPLCGAEEHPFATGNVPVPDETSKRLFLLRSDLKSVIDTISDFKVKLAKVNKDLERVSADQGEHADKMEDANRVIAEVCSELPSDLDLTASDIELNDKLNCFQKENRQELSHVENVLQSAEIIEKELSRLLMSVERVKDSVAKTERANDAAIHKKESAEQLLERLKAEADGGRDQQEDSLAQLQKEVGQFGVEALSIENLTVVLEHMRLRRDQWVARQNEKRETEKTVATLEIGTQHRAEQIQQLEAELKKHQQQLSDHLRERDEFSRQRVELFGEKSTDQEEASCLSAIESAEKAVDLTRQRLVDANGKFDLLKTRMAELQGLISNRIIQLKSSDDDFCARLKMAGFCDEENYMFACLAEAERKDLAQQSRNLSDEKTELNTRESEKRKLLELERAKNLTNETLTAIKENLKILNIDLNNIQQEIGAIHQKLKDNESLKQQQQTRIHAIDALKRECSRWDLLHELIGSADGKKYRNFAQGLTFDMMIGHANRKLQKMTDRYLLIRDSSQQLELNVIDNYQAGEIRSTKNLSGGESFIVSLALALGLSQMASRNVRVDSLFLDEGFGTLDDEALDTALETLSGLQQDGKLIGVISHVSALKDRISTQIKVTPQSGGRSQITGAGCSRPL